MKALLYILFVIIAVPTTRITWYIWTAKKINYGTFLTWIVLIGLLVLTAYGLRVV
jgi:hypothetical protein